MLRLRCRAAFGLVIVLLAGCLRFGPQPMPQPESEPPRQCTGDWRAHGYQSGWHGERVGVLQAWLQACPVADQDAARAAFREGHAAGMAEYCTAAEHYRRGRRGETLRPVCPQQDRERLQEAHRHGREIYLEVLRLRRDEQRLLDAQQGERLGALNPREHERFGDSPTPALKASRRDWDALRRRDEAWRKRYGAPPMPYQSRLPSAP